VTRIPPVLAAVLFSLPLGGCATGYVLRAAYEEAKILWRRQPIEQVLASEMDPDMRAKLELVLAVRRFAAGDLGLRVGGSYASIARVDQSQIVHVVSAAPRNRLVPYTWWFPIVGDVPYRGYFDKADADALASELEQQGYDTSVRPSVAFSTLGWFDDPLLSTVLRADANRLADTVIHELLHNTIYVAGHAAFNESFATFVGHRGAVAFFAAQGDTVRAEIAVARWTDALSFSAFLGRFIERLETAYAAGITADARTALFVEAQREFEGQQWLTGEYQGFARRPLNNAVILHDRLYADRLSLFEAAYVASGENLRVTIDTVRSRAEVAADPFAALAEFAGGVPPTARSPRACGSRGGWKPPARSRSG
jgi:predicted aminopeptidase